MVKDVGESAPVKIMLLEPVHSGLKTAFDVKVSTDDAPRVRTPLEGRVKGVQCVLARVVVVGST